MSHTPGPWRVADRFAVWTADSVGCEVARVEVESRDDDNLGRAEADARLIAAAPEMLALLRECSSALADLLSCTDPSGFECQEQWACVAECKAAIAKAEGRE